MNDYKEARDFDILLAGQFVAESMTGRMDYKPTTSFAETELRAYQEQYFHYCMMAKANIAMDSIGPQQADPMMKMLKKYVIDYISNNNNKKHPGMKYLYDLDKDDLIINQISMFSFMANMKNVNDIDNITSSELHSALNPETVSLAIGLYTYFTINVNKNYNANDFNKLFVESWIDYYKNIQVRYTMLRMNGNHWKDSFKGALLSD